MKKGNRRYKNWDNQGLALWLQQHMDARGWNAHRLSQEAGLSTASLISRWMDKRPEVRQRAAPEQLKKIAKAFGIDEKEALIAGGYLSPEPETDETQTPDPRRAELHRRLDAIDLTTEVYLAIDAMFKVCPIRQAQKHAPRTSLIVDPRYREAEERYSPS